ncbi:hypothetical protein C1646_681370 [Rhizophagus diaphanus]|nr:hypothetical protein C1646_681370 [Rhizophagus diaphanus] [Rhizophagus sp. MUCL 43196]
MSKYSKYYKMVLYYLKFLNGNGLIFEDCIIFLLPRDYLYYILLTSYRSIICIISFLPEDCIIFLVTEYYLYYLNPAD